MENHRKRHGFWITLGLAIAAFRGVEAPGRVNAAWTVGTPIVTYWGGPTLTDAVAQQAVSGGFNLVWASSPAELDVAQAHGLRALFSGSLDDATIAQVRNNRALYAYYLTDEPLASAFAGLGTTVAHLRTLDPNHMAYIDLPASYANPATQLGTSDYPTYLNQYMSTVHPSLLSYNNYQFMVGADTPDYFKNLAIISHTSQQSGVPFMNIVQACIGGTNWRLPNANELRYLAYTTLAYGGQGISYFNYGYSGGIQPPDSPPSPTYTAVQSINPQFVAIAQKLQPMYRIGTYHLGDLPPGWRRHTTDGSSPMRLPSSSPYQLSPTIPNTTYVTDQPVRGAVMGLFGPDAQLADATITLVVNLDYSNSLTTTVTGPGNLSVFDTTTGLWTPTGHPWATLDLPPGGGALVGLTSAVPEPGVLALLVTGLIGVLAYAWRKRK